MPSIFINEDVNEDTEGTEKYTVSIDFETLRDRNIFVMWLELESTRQWLDMYSLLVDLIKEQKDRELEEVAVLDTELE